jgi:hypothetical protein
MEQDSSNSDLRSSVEMPTSVSCWPRLSLQGIPLSGSKDWKSSGHELPTMMVNLDGNVPCLPA